MSDDNPTLSAEWLRFAEDDLDAAERLWAGKPLVRSVLFHSQQAAEKALKSRIVAAGEVPLRIHDLERLLDRCVQLHPSLEAVRGDAELLTDYGVEPRYPEAAGEYSEDDAERALAAGRRIVAAVKEVS